MTQILVHVLTLSFATWAQAPDLNLSRQRDRVDQQAQTEARDARMSSIQQGLLKGFRQISRGTGIDYARSKCSDGWQNTDYQNQAGQMCDGAGCVSLYAREPERFFGSLFTCYIFLGNGYECFAQGGMIKMESVFGASCTDKNLVKHHFFIHENGRVENKGVDKPPR